MRVIRPLSTADGAKYPEALPNLTEEELGSQGIYMAIGYPSHSVVYRGVWDKHRQECSWSFAYHVW